jgi:hypothetical protein
MFLLRSRISLSGGFSLLPRASDLLSVCFHEDFTFRSNTFSENQPPAHVSEAQRARSLPFDARTRLISRARKTVNTIRFCDACVFESVYFFHISWQTMPTRRFQPCRFCRAPRIPWGPGITAPPSRLHLVSPRSLAANTNRNWHKGRYVQPARDPKGLLSILNPRILFEVDSRMPKSPSESPFLSTRRAQSRR